MSFLKITSSRSELDEDSLSGTALSKSSERTSGINRFLWKKSSLKVPQLSKILDNRKSGEYEPYMLTSLEHEAISQKDLIIKMIDECCFYMEIVGRLSELLEHDGHVLKKCFDEKDAYYVYTSLINYYRLPHHRSHITITGYRVNANLSIAFRMLTKCAKLTKYLKENQGESAPFIRSMIRNTRDLYNLIIFNKSAKEAAQSRALYINILKLRNERNARIKTFKNIIQEITDEQSPSIHKLDKEINSIKAKAELYIVNHEDELNSIIYSSGIQLGRIEQKRLHTNKELEGTLQRTKEELLKLREKNLTLEAEKRKKVNKLKIVNEQWVGRFDIVKTQSRDKIFSHKSDISDLRQKITYYNMLILKHAEIYAEFKQEDEERKREILNRVTRSMAAAIIQNWWRNLKLYNRFKNVFKTKIL